MCAGCCRNRGHPGQQGASSAPSPLLVKRWLRPGGPAPNPSGRHQETGCQEGQEPCKHRFCWEGPQVCPDPPCPEGRPSEAVHGPEAGRGAGCGRRVSDHQAQVTGRRPGAQMETWCSPQSHRSESGGGGSPRARAETRIPGQPCSGLWGQQVPKWPHRAGPVACCLPSLPVHGDLLGGTHTHEYAGLCHFVSLWSLQGRRLMALLVAHQCLLLSVLSPFPAPRFCFLCCSCLVSAQQ